MITYYKLERFCFMCGKKFIINKKINYSTIEKFCSRDCFNNNLKDIQKKSDEVRKENKWNEKTRGNKNESRRNL